MTRWTRAAVILSLAGVAATLAGGCTTVTRVHRGSFKTLGRIETERLLQRGVSTRADVERLLGPPHGTGAAAFPVDPGLREIWFYRDVDASVLQEATSPGFHLEIQVQTLLVFFNQGIFDGCMWFSGPLKGTAAR